MSTSISERSAESTKDGAERRGASVSNKQIAKAASSGRKVAFKFFSGQTVHEVNGYVVGMDDYHWMVATVVPTTMRNPEDDVLALSLIHKSRADVIALPANATLESEDDQAKVALHSVGGPFWRYCETNFNGR